MAIQSIANLRSRAIEIKTAESVGENTALKVGSLFEDKTDTYESIFQTENQVVQIFNEQAPEANSNQIKTVAGKATVYNLHIPTNGNVITFDTYRRYGSPKVPLVGTILNNIVGAESGTSAVIYYRNAIEPTYPGNWTKVSGTYSTTKLNKITATYVDELQVDYTIESINDFYIGLELWYKFKDGAGATEILDYSGNSRHLDVINSEVTPAAWNGVATTEAVEGDYMGGVGDNRDALGGTYWTTILDTPLSFSSFSIVCWNKKQVGVMTDNQTPYFLIMRRTGGSSTAYGLEFYSLTTGRVRVRITNTVPTSFNGDTNEDSYLVNNGVMKPYIVTFNHQTLQLNIYNGTSLTPIRTVTLTGATGFPISVDAININRTSFGQAARQGGQYGETMFWSRVLTIDEISALQKRKNSFSPLT